MKNNQTEKKTETGNINIYEMLLWYQDHFSFNICEDIFENTQLEKQKTNTTNTTQTNTKNIWNRFDQQYNRNMLSFYRYLCMPL